MNDEGARYRIFFVALSAAPKIKKFDWCNFFGSKKQ
jgi:hypothetical protein